jgi:hypothetical protein
MMTETFIANSKFDAILQLVADFARELFRPADNPKFVAQ